MTITVGFLLIFASIMGTSIYSLRQINKVHVLVNSRLSLALQEISDLRHVVSSQQHQLDKE